MNYQKENVATYKIAICVKSMFRNCELNEIFFDEFVNSSESKVSEAIASNSDVSVQI